MVDKINDQSSLIKAKYRKSSPNATSLRESFRNLSSGLNVNDTLRDQPAVVHLAKAQSGDRTERMLNGLNEAVAFSSKALDALSQITDESSPSGPQRGAVEALTKGLDDIQSGISDILQGLKDKADTVDVMQSNARAAEAQMEDVEVAQSRAEDAGSSIQFNGVEAIKAHDGNGGITIAKVERLLSE